MRSRNPYFVGVVSSLLATLVTSAASAVLRARVTAVLVLGIVALALIAGLATFSALLLRQKKQIDRDLERLEVVSWPDWMRAIGLAAREAGIRVFREGGSIIFENAAGERYLLAADPAGREMGQVLARQRALEVLESWGMEIDRNSRGQRIAGS